MKKYLIRLKGIGDFSIGVNFYWVGLFYHFFKSMRMLESFKLKIKLKGQLRIT